MIYAVVLLQAEGAGGILQSMWPLILIIVVFYFFIIRPQQKKQKDQTSFLSNLEKGKQVVTTGGIIGRINKMEDDIITLQVDSKTFLKITKGSISKELTDAIPQINDGF
jgi:preprotein translocase subunit YajC